MGKGDSHAAPAGGQDSPNHAAIRAAGRRGKAMSREQANGLLDYYRAGGDVPEMDVLFALWVTGDLFSGAA